MFVFLRIESILICFLVLRDNTLHHEKKHDSSQCENITTYLTYSSARKFFRY